MCLTSSGCLLGPTALSACCSRAPAWRSPSGSCAKGTCECSTTRRVRNEAFEALLAFEAWERRPTEAQRVGEGLFRALTMIDAAVIGSLEAPSHGRDRIEESFCHDPRPFTCRLCPFRRDITLATALLMRLKRLRWLSVPSVTSEHASSPSSLPSTTAESRHKKPA
jgi:hypothetical protein